MLNDVATYKSRVRERRKRAASEAAAGMAAAAGPASLTQAKRAKEEHKRTVVNPDAEPGSVEARRNDPEKSA